MKYTILVLLLFVIFCNCEENDLFLLSCKKIESMEFHGEASVWKFTDINKNAVNISSGDLVDTNEKIIPRINKKNTWVKASLIIPDHSDESFQLIKGNLDKDDFEKNGEKLTF